MTARSGLELAAKGFWERASDAAPAAVAWRNVRRFMGARIIAAVWLCPAKALCVGRTLLSDAFDFDRLPLISAEVSVIGAAPKKPPFCLRKIKVSRVGQECPTHTYCNHRHPVLAS